MTRQVIDVGSARREDVVVVAQGLEKPFGAHGRVPRVVGKVIEALDAKASDGHQSCCVDWRQAGREQPAWTPSHTGPDYLPARSLQRRRTMAAQSPRHGTDQSRRGEGLASINERVLHPKLFCRSREAAPNVRVPVQADDDQVDSPGHARTKLAPR